MKFIQLLRLLLRNWLILAIVTLFVGGGVLLYSRSRPPLFTATSVQYVSLAGGGSTFDLAQGSNYVQDQMASFGQLATSPLVLNYVTDDLVLSTSTKDLARAIAVTTPRNTVILRVAVTDRSPQQAAAIANAVGVRLADAVDIVGPKATNGKAAIAVRSIQTALPPNVQSSPNTRRNTLVGLLIGFLIATGAVILRSRLDSVVRTPETLAQITTHRIIGTVRQAANLKETGLAVVNDPRSDSAEDLRRLRSGIELLASTRQNFALIITSSIRSEGRTTIAANTAAALAEAGYRTVLVDADLRAPGVATATATDPALGLIHILEGRADLAASLQHASVGGFDVLNAGGTHDNPTTLLTSEQLGTTVSQLRHQYDFVIIDTPPVLAVSDASAVQTHADGALFVVNADRVHEDQLGTALHGEDLSGQKTLGLVMNNLAPWAMPSATGYQKTGGRS